ncbi:MAG: MMPL family transporter [Gammaproteobacteria bacterium]|nr:MMPL family transporter [Gammaproteobacteria bacterium]NNC96494.1 MMPL family transporter [Gammaproteobacteria bacterium]NNM14722.1 MMPL family transporter [Gammaproteobacteria bacterium]
MQFANRVLDHRIWVILATLIIVAVSTIGFKNYQMYTDFRMFFGEDNPQLLAFDELEDTYEKNDVLLFIIEPAGGKVFDSEVLAAIEDLTERAWTLKYSSRIDSITNFQHTYAEDDDLIVEDLVSYASDLSPEELAEKEHIALNEPALINRIISQAADVTGVSVTYQVPDESVQATLEAYYEGVALRDAMEKDYPFLNIRLSGFVAMDGAFFEASEGDNTGLGPLMFLGILLMLALLLRSLVATGVSLFVILFSVAIGFGVPLWLGLKVTSASAVAPLMIMTLAVADCVHLLVTLLQGLGNGMQKRAAIIESVRVNFLPIMLTSVTTAIGFMMMNFSDSPPFRHLGNIVALGVIMAFILSVTFLPAMISYLPLKAKMRQDNFLNTFMDRLADFVVTRHSALLFIGIVLSIVTLTFIPRNELNDEWVKYFSTDTDFRQDTTFAMERLAGMYQIAYSVKSNEVGGVAEPEYLHKLAEFKEWFEQQPGVRHVDSMSETFARLNKNMHGDDPAYQRIPESRKLAAQYLLLYEMSLPLGLDINNRMDIDKSQSQFVVSLGQLSTNEIRALALAGEDWIKENAPELSASATGGSVMFSYLSERNIKGMLRGTLLGLVLISGLLIIALRSVKMGLISLLPNLLPAGLAFGLWGLLVGQVNMASSIVTCMVLGIVVDDTVHFLSKYLRARREKGLDANAAVRFAFSSVGTALLVTTLILMFGFGILAQSDFNLNASLARLTALAIGLALVVDFLLLPPLLIKLDNKPRGAGKTELETNIPLESSVQGA